MMTKLKHLKYRILEARGSGLLPLPKDNRDLTIQDLGWGFGYTPKHTRHIIPTLSVKNQLPRNSCQWEATTVQKEVDEGKILSSRSLVIKGKEMGLVSGDGYSNMRSGQKVLQKWGILSAETCPDESRNNWSNFLNFNVNKYSDEAAKHKIQSYWKVSSLNDVYKLLDEGRILTTGMSWYTGYNMKGGFKWPWIILKFVGWVVGGHAIAVIGYDKNYQGVKTLVCQNSYGKLWGDKGRFHITEDYFVKHCLKKYGCFVNLDVPATTGQFIKQYQGRVVKGDNSNGVFMIQGEKKRPYVSWDAFYSWNPLNINSLVKLINVVPQSDIDAIKDGVPLTVDGSPNFKALNNLKRPFLIHK